LSSAAHATPPDGRERRWRLGLRGAQVLGATLVVTGLAIVIVAHAAIRSDVQAELDDLARTVAAVEHRFEHLESHEEVTARAFEDAARLVTRMRSALDGLPALMSAAGDTIAETATLLRSTAKDLRTVAKAVDLFVDEGGLIETSKDMDQAAARMRDMAKSAEDLGGDLRRVRASAREVGEPVEELLKRASGGWGATLGDVSGALRDAREALRGSPLPLYVALLMDLVGLGLFALGVLLVVLAGGLRRVATDLTVREEESEDAPRLRGTRRPAPAAT